MSAPALPLCLLLWTAGTAVSRTSGEVTAPPRVTAEAGSPVLLSCNVTTAPDDVIHQVRWLDERGRVLLAYKQSAPPVHVSRQADNVQLADVSDGASFITIETVHLDNEGCYRCIFDVFPKGPQEGRTCVSVTGKVHLEGNKTTVNGTLAALSCSYSLPERVRQVLWRKTAEQGDTTTVASHAGPRHHSVPEPFARRVALSRSLGHSQLTIRPVKTEDEACYTCEFHTYPDGAKSATACLSVYVLPKPEVSHETSSPGATEANCTARSRPAAEVTWSVEGDNRTLGPPVLSARDHGDGTTTVTSTLLLPSALLAELAVTCTVRHRGLAGPLTVPLDASAGPATVVLLSLCGVAAVLLLCLCACLCRCFVCTGD